MEHTNNSCSKAQALLMPNNTVYQRGTYIRCFQQRSGIRLHRLRHNDTGIWGTAELVYDGVGTGNGTWKGTAVSSGSDKGVLSPISQVHIVPVGERVSDAHRAEYTISGKFSAGVAFSLVKRQSFSKSYKGDGRG